MYKFNLLNKINQEKEKNQKINHIINLVFYSTVTISVVLIMLMVGKSLVVGNSYDDYKLKFDDIVKKSNRLRSNNGYLNTDRMRRLYEFQDKRIQWTVLLGTLEANMDTLSAIEELSFDGKKIDCKVLVKVEPADNDKASIMRIMTGFQSRLGKDSVFITFLKDQSEKNVIVAEQPNFNQEEKNIWFYRLQFDTKDIVVPAASVNNSQNAIRRF